MEKLKIVVGSIQSTVFCFDFDPLHLELNKIFTTNDHVGKLRSLHITEDLYLVSSGEDENIKLYDLGKNQKLSNIFGVSGVSNKIVSSKKYLIAATEKGQVFIIGKKDFALYHKFKVFQNSCVDICLHPSGLLLMCLSQTGRFSFWDLATCRMIFHKKINKLVEKIEFLDSENLILIARNSFYVFYLPSQ